MKFKLLNNFEIFLGSSISHTERKVYSFFDVLGDYGGIELVLKIIFASLIKPFSQLNFQLVLISKMYHKFYASKKTGRVWQKVPI